MEDCSICLSKLDNNIVSKWSCSHQFHSSCIINWNKFCPLCKTTKINNPSIQFNNQNVLDIAAMKNICNNLEGNIKHIYLELWNDTNCLQNNHSLICLENFGVKIICENCNLIQCFNKLH